jgi:thiosulfate dehydrogenase [quinone] large subunit
MVMKGMVWVQILVGAVWLNGALEKLFNPHFPQQFAQSLKVGGFISQAPPFFRAFMEGVVAPNAETFAQIVRFVELSLGIALLLGLLTDLASLGSIAQSLVIMFSQGGVAFGTGLGAPEFLNVDLMMAVLSVIDHRLPHGPLQLDGQVRPQPRPPRSLARVARSLSRCDPQHRAPQPSPARISIRKHRCRQTAKAGGVVL